MWIEKQTNPIITYSDIKAGNIFEYEGKTFIKTTYCSSHSTRICCVNLATGDVNYLLDDDEVIPLKGKVVIE